MKNISASLLASAATVSYLQGAVSFTPKTTFAFRQGIPSSASSAIHVGNTFQENETAKQFPSKYAWEKDPPKRSLSSNQAETAFPWILNLVEAAHWAVFVPPLVTAYSMIANYNVWWEFLDQDPLRMFLWILAPIVSGIVCPLPPIVSHMYEDWQIAPTKNVLHSEDSDAITTAAQEALTEEHNNARLHKVAMNLMFTLLTIQGVVLYHGFAGLNEVLPISLGAVAISCLGDKNLVLSRVLPILAKEQHKQALRDTTVGSVIGLAVGSTLKLVTYFSLAAQIMNTDDASVVLPVLLVLGCLLEFSGGPYEGTVAESSFSQWDHLVAILLMLVGQVLQSYVFFQLPQFLM